MNSGVPRVSNPPSPSLSQAATTRDTAANPRFPGGEPARQTSTPIPHGERYCSHIETQARRTPGSIQTQGGSA